MTRRLHDTLSPALSSDKLPAVPHHYSPLQYLVGFARIAVWISCVIWLARSAIRPRADENLRSYDKVLRAVGVLILGTLLAFGLPRWLGWVK